MFPKAQLIWQRVSSGCQPFPCQPHTQRILQFAPWSVGCGRNHIAGLSPDGAQVTSNPERFSYELQPRALDFCNLLLAHIRDLESCSHKQGHSSSISCGETSAVHASASRVSGRSAGPFPTRRQASALTSICLLVGLARCLQAAKLASRGHSPLGCCSSKALSSKVVGTSVPLHLHCIGKLCASRREERTALACSCEASVCTFSCTMKTSSSLLKVEVLRIEQLSTALPIDAGLVSSMFRLPFPKRTDHRRPV